MVAAKLPWLPGHRKSNRRRTAKAKGKGAKKEGRSALTCSTSQPNSTEGAVMVCTCLCDECSFLGSLHPRSISLSRTEHVQPYHSQLVSVIPLLSPVQGEQTLNKVSFVPFSILLPRRRNCRTLPSPLPFTLLGQIPRDGIARAHSYPKSGPANTDSQAL